MPDLVYYPYMASVVGKKRGGATYYYLVESARVHGKPRITSQEYLGTAEELAAAMRGGGLGLPDRVQHKDFGAVAAAWGVLEDLGVAAVIDQAAQAPARDRGRLVHLPGHQRGIDVDVAEVVHHHADTSARLAQHVVQQGGLARTEMARQRHHWDPLHRRLPDRPVRGVLRTGP